MIDTSSPLVNRVAESDLQTIALDQLVDTNNILIFDLKEYLFQGLILREKDFREALKQIDWTIYKDKAVGVVCSTDAIIPMWAYMIVASYISPYAAVVEHGDKNMVFEKMLVKYIQQQDWSYLQDKRIVVKGCSDMEIPAAAYLAIGKALQPIVQNIMYGEPCSTVPIFKRPRKI